MDKSRDFFYFIRVLNKYLTCATGHSLRLAPAHGTDCHHRFGAFILLLFLNDN